MHLAGISLTAGKYRLSEDGKIIPSSKSVSPNSVCVVTNTAVPLCVYSFFVIPLFSKYSKDISGQGADRMCCQREHQSLRLLYVLGMGRADALILLRTPTAVACNSAKGVRGTRVILGCQKS